MTQFYDYFKENMTDLGLTAPESLFGTQQAAIGTISTILAFTDKHGTRVTVQEMIGAGTKLERLAAVGAVAAAFYAGAAIGSLAVSTGRTLSGGLSLNDVLSEASKSGVSRDWLLPHFQHRPAMYKPGASGRRHHKHLAFK